MFWVVLCSLRFNQTEPTGKKVIKPAGKSYVISYTKRLNIFYQPLGLKASFSVPTTEIFPPANRGRRRCCRAKFSIRKPEEVESKRSVSISSLNLSLCFFFLTSFKFWSFVETASKRGLSTRWHILWSLFLQVLWYFRCSFVFT